ncbi:MAG: phosphoserine phosphatase RsbU/P [Alphaproteobacteria bacterium]|jgi:PleD family two-component response regulator|nr:phosphoserine phosphatase RsbU/P [Alphaproteobacteria bacterium]
MRILVVDDAEDSRDIIEAALLSGGYKDIVPAVSGWEAIKFLDVGRDASGRPAADIVLLDIMMPEIDGIETCARIRNDPRYVDIPIIMVTSLDDMDSLANAFMAGANDYVTKPLNRIELIARVRAALKLKAELERRQARERELLLFLSNWGDKHASVWIDEATGLFVGEAAEAYLTAVTERHPGATTSVLALAIDRLEVVRAAQGEEAARRILAQVAGAVRRASAQIGAVAASYRNGLITVVLPEFDAGVAKTLGETLRSLVAKLAIANPESIAADHLTASVAVATASVRSGSDRVQLLTRAIASAQGAAASGGNRVVAVDG